MVEDLLWNSPSSFCCYGDELMLPSLMISLTPPGIRTIQWIQWGLTFLTGALLLWSTWIWLESHTLRDRIAHYEAAVKRGQQINQQYIQQLQREGFDLSKSRQQTLPKEVAFAKRLRMQQAFSWTRFLSDLETAVPPRISMASVSLNFKNGSIALGGSAEALKDLMSFVEKLEAHPAFHNVVLSKHFEKTKGGKNKIPYIVFNMTVSYYAQFAS